MGRCAGCPLAAAVGGLLQWAAMTQILPSPAVYSSPSERPPQPCAVAIGAFDGLHRGHQALLAELRAQALALGVPALVYTFDPPTRVLLQGSEFLSTLEEKLELLGSLGVREVIAAPFTHEFAARPKGDFLADLAALRPEALVVGEDFRFGRGRTGGVDDLRGVCARLTEYPLLHCGGEAIKSSRVRALLGSGAVHEAAALLGRPYSLRGTVVRGDQLGRTLGYPTANLTTPPGKALPRGVYAAWAHTEGERTPAMLNIGLRPTVGGQALRVEAHLLGFDGDLYGQTLRADLVARLRGEERFASLDDLKAQLARDAHAARAALER